MCTTLGIKGEERKKRGLKRKALNIYPNAPKSHILAKP